MIRSAPPECHERYPRDPDPEIGGKKAAGDIFHVCVSSSKRNGLWVWVSFLVLISRWGSAISAACGFADFPSSSAREPPSAYTGRKTGCMITTGRQARKIRAR